LEKYERRNAEADELNAQLDEKLNDLNTILTYGLNRDPSVDFNKFLKYPTEADLESDETLRLIPEPRPENYLPHKPSFFVRLIPWINDRYLATVAGAWLTCRCGCRSR
jgi:hypothetical protein